jgi:hypothetical protein
LCDFIKKTVTTSKKQTLQTQIFLLVVDSVSVTISRVLHEGGSGCSFRSIPKLFHEPARAIQRYGHWYFMTVSAVKALNKAILLWFTRLDELQFNAFCFAPTGSGFLHKTSYCKYCHKQQKIPLSKCLLK